MFVQNLIFTYYQSVSINILYYVVLELKVHVFIKKIIKLKKMTPIKIVKKYRFLTT